MIKCTRCHKKLPKEAFSLKGNSKSILATRCNECREKPAVTWNDRNKDKVRLSMAKFIISGGARAARLKKRYGVSLDEYDALHVAQDGCCAICKAPKPGGKYSFLHVDHDHETGKVRGLLCTNCNRALGYMGDDPLRLTIAAAYLSK